VLSNSVRSLVKPALHVGEQIAGGAGCRAWAGSGGMAGAWTTGGGNGGEPVAQPLTSVGSSSGVSTGTIQSFSGVIGGFLQLGAAALFFGPSLGLGPARGVGQRPQLLGVLGTGIGVRGLLGAQPQGLQHQGGQQ
jgi:hypothetical protein